MLFLSSVAVSVTFFPWRRRLCSPLLSLLGLVLVSLDGLAGEGLLELLLLLEVALALGGFGLAAAGLALLADDVGDGADDGEEPLDAEAELGGRLPEVRLGLVVVVARQRGVLLGPVRLLGAVGLCELLRRLPTVRDQEVLRPRGAGARDRERLLLEVAILALALAFGVVFGHIAAEERHMMTGECFFFETKFKLYYALGECLQL
jgi:hypothetical protein